MLLFLCLFVFPLTSANQKTRNSMFGHSLLASPYNETDVGELWECYKLCYDDKENCASINYDMKKGRCKRMKVTHVNLPRELVKMKDYVYADIRADIRGCAKKSYPLGMEDGSIPDSSITASSHYSASHSPYYGRLNNQAISNIHGGAWAAKINKKDEYLQVDLGRFTWVTHVATQGRPKETGYMQWVTVYTVEYSLTGEQWQSYQYGNGVIKVRHMYTVEYSLKEDQWQSYQDVNGVIKVRHIHSVEYCLTGNQWQSYPDGNGVIKVRHMYSVKYSLTGDQWQSYQEGNGVIKVRHIHSVEYCLTGNQWQSYPDGNGVIKIFPGNSGQTTVVKNEFSPVIKARYVRIVVQAWYSYITMRAEFYGCAA
ncbi:coagulation factor V [Nematostella vectensis]|uniref:coagulation factor V n=1 Tax=Nematostella vectensis TaxID=45351 RepID=UPI002077280C|nr:coagulation factor V [Nematostella vectensis]